MEIDIAPADKQYKRNFISQYEVLQYNKQNQKILTSVVAIWGPEPDFNTQIGILYFLLS